MTESTDSGADGRGGLAIRQCFVSRRRAPQGSLLRLSRGLDGMPVVDIKGRAGRGVYVAPEFLATAVSRAGLSRALAVDVQCMDAAEADALVEGTARRLERRFCELLGIAKRAGGVEFGMDAVLETVRRRALAVIVVAPDLAPRSRSKIDDAVNSRDGVTVIEGPSRQRIGAAIGKNVVGVVAVTHPKLGQALLDEAGRLSALPRVGAEAPAGTTRV